MANWKFEIGDFVRHRLTLARPDVQPAPFLILARILTELPTVTTRSYFCRNKDGQTREFNEEELLPFGDPEREPEPAAYVLPILQFRYRNHRGEESIRRVAPVRLYYGRCSWHGEDVQLLLEAKDLDKGALRTFALRDVLEWMVPHE